MNDQRISRHSKNFVKYEEGQQVGSKTDADCAAEAHGKSRKITRLIFFFMPSHIADGINRCEDPKARSDTAENQPRAVHFELQTLSLIHI